MTPKKNRSVRINNLSGFGYESPFLPLTQDRRWCSASAGTVVPQRDASALNNNTLTFESRGALEDFMRNQQLEAEVGQLLGHLYDRYAPPLSDFARRLTGDRDLAEDLVMGALKRAVERWSTFEEYGHGPLPWLKAILKNLYIAHQRQLLRANTVSWDEHHEFIPAEIPKIEDLVIRADSAEKLRAAIRSTLTQKQGEVILLRSQGFTLEQIASLLNIPAGTVASRQHEGLKRLRACKEVQEIMDDPGL